MASSTDKIIELNVGGVHYATFLSTLRSDANSLLAKFFPEADGPAASVSTLQQDAAGRYFIDRDGVLFRFVLDFLRNRRLVMPESFQERRRLRQEADYYQLADLILHLTTCPTTPPPPPALGGMTSNNNSSADISSSVVESNTGDPASQDDKYSGYITVGYRGTFAAGREGMADVRFRKLTRILICGRVALCRQVFGDSLNESRDPDRGSLSRYTSRFFLKHTSLEQAFEDLGEAGFTLVACCASGTSGASGDTKPGTDSEENRWNHYNEFIFSRY